MTPSGDERREPPPRAARRLGKVRRGSAVMAVGRDDVRPVHVDRPPPAGGEDGGEDGGRHPLAAGDEHVAGARRQVPEHADRAAQIAVFARRRIDPREQRASCRSRGQHGPDDFAVTPQEHRGDASRPLPPCRPRRALAPFSRRSVTPASADATTTSGPACAAMSAAALWMAAASASEAPPNFQISRSRGADVTSTAPRRDRFGGHDAVDRPAHGVVVVRQLHRRVRIPRRHARRGRSCGTRP